ncbi:class I SAM-dependent methyltransferase [Baaleninema simplex]|uniref:class I SAM-dependent methyltransferase n=1 Tax=Baaleninema simplex TaxID=2862350 RepID=UPI0003482AF1|nr:class I SAM-dependent methyltransferase [Baaleninema simplex]
MYGIHPTPTQTSLDFGQAFRNLLTLPPHEQFEAAAKLRSIFNIPAQKEEWNTQFNGDSLFAAWTRCTLMHQLYTSNALILRNWLQSRRQWRVIDIGGGDGRLWSYVLNLEDEGELVVVDPASEVHEQVRQKLPPGVSLVSIQAPVETVELGEADAVVCSLILHHVAGMDANERRNHGLEGSGKLEILQEIAKALKPRQGLGILNEADFYSDLGLPSGHPLLVNNLIEAYVRRVGFSLLLDAEAIQDDGDGMAERWYSIINQWCLGQLDKAYAPVAERYDYFLDLPRWLASIERAGLKTIDRKCTDNFGIFYQYILKSKEY